MNGPPTKRKAPDLQVEGALSDSRNDTPKLAQPDGDSSAHKPPRQPGADLLVLLDGGTTILVPSNASARRYLDGPQMVLDASMLRIGERAYFQALGVFGVVQ